MSFVVTTRPPVDVPATPDADEAREAAEHELAQEIYQDRGGFWEHLLRWLDERLDPTQVVPGAPPWLSVLVVVLAAAVLIGVLLLLLRRATLARRARPSGRALFEGDERSARDLERDADAAATRQDWALAVVDRFRAVIRSLDERGLIEDYPGMTAQEAGALACRALLDVEGLHAALQQAAGLFDAVRYGRVVSTGQQDEWMRLLAERVTHAAPAEPAPAHAQAPTTTEPYLAAGAEPTLAAAPTRRPQ